MTGFDAPSCSTVYLDRPMRNHTLMQTIARANRVFPEKENGLIVDYIGVFRDLEKALAIYGAATGDDRVDSPIQDKAALVAALDEAVEACAELCERYDVDLDELRAATGFEFIALRDAAVEALLVDDEVREAFLDCGAAGPEAVQGGAARPGRRRPPGDGRRDPRARRADPRLGRGERPDIETSSDAVDALLDRSVGAEEYVIRAAAEGVDADPLIDLSQIDFDALAARFAGRKRSETERLADAASRPRAVARGTEEPDPARAGRADRAADRRVQRRQPQHRRVPPPADRALARPLRRGAARAAAEGLTEEELAIFDLLTKPDPELTDERARAGEGRREAPARARPREARARLAPQGGDRGGRARRDPRRPRRAPRDPYPRTVYDAKVQAVFDHVSTAYGDDGSERVRRAGRSSRRREPAPAAGVDR